MVLSGAEGIRTVALGGRLGPAIASRGFVEGNEDAKELPPCSLRDAKELNGASDADLLLINERQEGLSHPRGQQNARVQRNYRIGNGPASVLSFRRRGGVLENIAIQEPVCVG